MYRVNSTWLRKHPEKRCVCVCASASAPVCPYNAVFCIEIGDFGEVRSFNYTALKQNMSGVFRWD